MRFILLLLAFSASSLLTAQSEILTAELISSKTKEQLAFEYFLLGLNFISGVDAYSVTYTSVDVHGNPDTLSGLVALPTNPGFSYPKLAYMHGTVDNRWAVPSQLTSEGSSLMAYAGIGGIAVAPDYPGLGTGRGFHPYVHVESQSRSGIDLIRAAQAFALEKEVQYNDGLLITGYSQGGHGALGLHKEIEEKYSDEFTVSASSPMSGPHSLSDIMLNLVLDGSEYGFAAYLPNTIISMQTAYGDIYDDLSEIFKPVYVPMIQSYIDEEIGLFDLNDQLLAKINELEGGNFVIKMFNEELIDELNTNENHPFLVALRANDLVDWAPQAPTRLYYCTGDDQVPFLNSLVAEEGMIAAGGQDVAAIQVGGEAVDHGGCVLPASTNSGDFLIIHQTLGIINSIQELMQAEVSVFPNPAFDQLNLIVEDQTSISSVKIVNQFGQIGLSAEIANTTTLDIQALAPGLHIAQLYDQDGNWVASKKFIKR